MCCPCCDTRFQTRVRGYVEGGVSVRGADPSARRNGYGRLLSPMDRVAEVTDKKNFQPLLLFSLKYGTILLACFMCVDARVIFPDLRSIVPDVYHTLFAVGS